MSVTLAVFALLCFTSCSSALEDFNTTDETYLAVLRSDGAVVYIKEELSRRLKEEQETWHWLPWLRTRTQLSESVLREASCVDANSVESFPDSAFDENQLRNGAFLLYVLFGIYTFTLLAIVCNDFFIPCVELICEDLKIPQNVAAATFMAVATSCPEFFVNVISTFITGSDMGIGTIVGSAIFNALGVAAIGGLSAIRPIKIEMLPVTRDVVIYLVNASVLVVIVWDGQVDWYEAVTLAVMYVVYFVYMFNSMRIFAMFARCCSKTGSMDIMTNIENSEMDKHVEEGMNNKGFSGKTVITNGSAEKPLDDVNIMTSIENSEMDKPVEEGMYNKGFSGKTVVTNGSTEKPSNDDEFGVKPKKGLLRFPKEKSLLYIFWWIYVWPIKLILGCTIPSPTTCRKFYPFAFFMCIIWIGITSYFVSWSMTVIGNTFFIPDSVMGMTFLAFGGCLPEACSIFIMSRKGEGGIGVSNALGANSLAILFALGLPWLIRTLTLLGQGEEGVVYINSNGIDFVIGSLLVAVTCLWITLCIGRFTLRKSVGATLAILYSVFITFAILVETGVILDRLDAFC